MSLQTWDEEFLLSIQRYRHPLLTKIMIGFTWTAIGRCWWTSAILLNLISRYYVRLPAELLNAFFAPLLVWAMNYVLKKAIKRDRPSVTNKEITALVKAPCFSFPSSHAGSTFSFFFILWWWHFPWTAAIAAWAAIVSISRMYLGVHYLSDILAGIIVGLISAVLVFRFF
jgi:undecaprenyl-diphosphatase